LPTVSSLPMKSKSKTAAHRSSLRKKNPTFGETQKTMVAEAAQPTVPLNVSVVEIIRKGREARTRRLMRVFSGNAKNQGK
jgi:hypothetical protein